MWLLELILVLVTVIVAWSLYGYFVALWFVGLFRKATTPVLPESWPFISMIVPCYNEKDHIIDKLVNTRELDYPRDKLEVVFVDGGSTDGTVSLLESEIRPDEPYRAVTSPVGGKICQINYALPLLKGEIVVNTDTDAILDSDALKWLVAEFSGQDVAVVGAYCRPLNSLELDMHHWDSHNKGRFLETNFWSTSIVLAPCYAFRKGLIQAFPEDVVADDIHIALWASVSGFRVVLSRAAKALETRVPIALSEFIPHKYRKANAYLRESLRFVYLLPQMNPLTKFIFLSRMLQQLLLPWALLFWFLLREAMVTIFRVDLAILSGLFVLTVGGMAKWIFDHVELPDSRRNYSFGTVIKGNLITLTILITTGFGYAWFRQDSSYSRLDTRACSRDGKDRRGAVR